MTQTHFIKLNEKFCSAVLSGDKNFEIRKNDRGYQKGDFIRFVPIADDGTHMYHPVSAEEYLITYVLNGYGLRDEYCVFGIKKSRTVPQIIGEDIGRGMTDAKGGEGVKLDWVAE